MWRERGSYLSCRVSNTVIFGGEEGEAASRVAMGPFMEGVVHC